MLAIRLVTAQTSSVSAFCCSPAASISTFQKDAMTALQVLRRLEKLLDGRAVSIKMTQTWSS